MTRLDIPILGARGSCGDEGVVPYGCHGFTVAMHEWLGHDMKILENLAPAPADNDLYHVGINVPQ